MALAAQKSADASTYDTIQQEARAGLAAVSSRLPPAHVETFQTAIDASASRVAAALAEIALIDERVERVPVDELPRHLAQREGLVGRLRAEVIVLDAVRRRIEAAAMQAQAAAREAGLTVLRAMEADHLRDGEAIDAWLDAGMEILTRFCVRQRALYAERSMAELPRGATPSRVADVLFVRLAEAGLPVPRATLREVRSFAALAAPLVPPPSGTAD